MDSDQCEATKRSGYWKGYRCGNRAKLTYKGKRYCAVHYGIEVAADQQEEHDDEDES